MTTSTSSIDRRRLLTLAAAAGIAGAAAAVAPERAWAQTSRELVAFSATELGLRAHLYPDIAGARAHFGVRPAVAPEFFDITGRRLLPTFDGQGNLAGLRAALGAARPEVVFGKLLTVIADVRKSVPVKAEALPRLDGVDGADLETAFGLCRPVFGHVSPGGISINHQSNPLHNLLAHGLR